MKKEIDIKDVKRFSSIFFVGLFILVLACTCFTVIPAGHTGVVTRFGAVSEDVLQEGMHLKMPIDKVHEIDNRIVRLNVEMEAFSSDLQSIQVSSAINYRVDQSKSYRIYKNIGSAYENVLISPTAEEIFKSVLAKYTAEEAVDNRSKITDEIKDEMGNVLVDYGVNITGINITNFDLSDAYLNAVEEKVTAQQNLEKAKTEEAKKTMEKQQEAERQKIQADANLYAAQKQAEANKALAESLNDTLVEYNKIEKWDGKLPSVTSGNAIVDFRSIEENS